MSDRLKPYFAGTDKSLKDLKAGIPNTHKLLAREINKKFKGLTVSEINRSVENYEGILLTGLERINNEIEVLQKKLNYYI